MANSKSLNRDFLLEFFRASLANTNILETGMGHIKYSYLPSQQYKTLWKGIIDHYRVNGLVPSIGVLGQKFFDNPDTLSLLADMKEVGIPTTDELLEQLELYIKNVKFQQAYDDMYSLFQKGDKDASYKAMEKYAEDINNFSIRSQYFEKVFSGFTSRMTIRETIADNPTNVEYNFKIPFGIDELDSVTLGGMNAGDTACFLAQSGVGKTKLLKWFGVHAARLGYRVAHFQAEGTKQECMDLYDATWSGVLLHTLEQGIITDIQRKRIDTTISNIKHLGGEIYVEAFEQFGTASVLDIRNSLVELEKIHGNIHLVLIDYLEKVDPGDGQKYGVDQEKQRREAVSQKMKNIATEFKTRVVTATQAHGIERRLLDNPEFVMDRYNTSMGKNLLDPFSYFISLNQTEDEYNNNLLRLYCDKLRKYKAKQIIYIHQNYDYEKFYDGPRTRQRFFRQE